MEDSMPKDSKQIHIPTTEPFIFAHRGLSATAPENTLEAFHKAADHGATWIETDLDILPDGTVILMHDSTLDRTSDATGSIYDLSFEDLATVDAGAWFGEEYSGARIPTVNQMIDFMNEKGVNANLELKVHENGEEGARKLVKEVAGALDNLDPAREIIVSSFSLPQMKMVAEEAPELTRAVLSDKSELPDNWREIAEGVGASYVHINDEGLTEQTVKMIRDGGFGVNVWTVNDVDRAKELFSWGATGVFTDHADVFTEELGF